MSPTHALPSPSQVALSEAVVGPPAVAAVVTAAAAATPAADTVELVLTGAGVEVVAMTIEEGAADVSTITAEVEVVGTTTADEEGATGLELEATTTDGVGVEVEVGVVSIAEVVLTETSDGIETAVVEVPPT